MGCEDIDSVLHRRHPIQIHIDVSVSILRGILQQTERLKLLSHSEQRLRLLSYSEQGLRLLSHNEQRLGLLSHSEQSRRLLSHSEQRRRLLSHNEQSQIPRAASRAPIPVVVIHPPVHVLTLFHCFRWPNLPGRNRNATGIPASHPDLLWKTSQ